MSAGHLQSRRPSCCICFDIATVMHLSLWQQCCICHAVHHAVPVGLGCAIWAVPALLLGMQDLASPVSFCRQCCRCTASCHALWPVCCTPVMRRAASMLPVLPKLCGASCCALYLPKNPQSSARSAAHCAAGCSSHAPVICKRSRGQSRCVWAPCHHIPRAVHINCASGSASPLLDARSCSCRHGMWHRLVESQACGSLRWVLCAPLEATTDGHKGLAGSSQDCSGVQSKASHWTAILMCSQLSGRVASAALFPIHGLLFCSFRVMSQAQVCPSMRDPIQ